jgi:hypothetical protein
MMILLVWSPRKISAQQPTRAIVAGFSSWQYSGSYAGSQPLNAGFFVGFKTNKARYFNTRFELGFGRAQGQSMTFANLYGNSNQGPSPSFITDIYYGGLDLNLNILKKPSHTLYITGGIGLMRFDPKDGQGNGLATINTTRQLGEAYSQSSVWFPLGIGATYWILNGPGIGLQVTYQNPSTRYIDNVDKLSPNSVADQLFVTRVSIFIPLPASKPRLSQGDPKRKSRSESSQQE